ncbi:MAG: ATP-dependent DNA helicase [Flavobacteriaceae bacterium TMED238]|nr:ATP-dependent DNA helicase [Flavobacteriales bacterium]RPG60847.1 MAG: ATP-dependent DNA helicase [Flavobacteriaceae bacterium TMED238]
MKNYLENLNEEQRQPVLHKDGPLIVIAGAGSGKTRVLTYRIVHLINQGVDPFNILALTFTNKAATEMKKRISEITSESISRNLWMGTFHSVFARILRSEAPLIGYPTNFTIYDTYDSEKLISNIIKELKLEKDHYKAKTIRNRISSLKNNFVSVESYFNNPELIEVDKSSNREQFGNIYREYVRRCFMACVMDFDDLLLKTNELLKKSPEALLKYQDKFKYILVDEYQDTNYSQYLIVKALADRHENLCVVGDDSQSIYSFRGANIDNILNFKKHYPDSKSYKLEQNYRSTKNIVQAANSLINHNILKLDKTIWTDNNTGDKILLNKSQSDSDEGRYVSSNIFELKNNYQLKNSSFAVLYRTNAQSRSIEDALRKINIDYQVFGGLSFYQRKEVKDVLAYMRVIENINDEESLRRIINFPPRGIGQTTLDKLVIISKDHEVSLFNAISKIDKKSKVFSSRTIEKLEDFKNLILSFKIYSERNNAYETANLVIHKTKLIDFYRDEGTLESMNRIENIEELLNGVNDFIDQQLEIFEGDNSLSKYLQDVALYSETDKEIQSEKVSLMSIHMAKGLEFPIVYVVGLEENLFPSIMSINSREEIEEERRLFYVAMTRAKEKLILSHCEQRFKWGNIIDCEPSRFLSEVDVKFINNINTSRNYIRQKIDENKLRIKKLPHKNLLKINSTSISKIKNPLVNINLNEKVYHERFGEGIVEDIEGEGDNIRAKINFKSSGEKKLLLKFAKLKILK